MKHSLRKTLHLVLFLTALSLFTACGVDRNVPNNNNNPAADQSQTATDKNSLSDTSESAALDPTLNNTMTDGTNLDSTTNDTAHTTDGVLGDLVDGIANGAADVADGVADGVEDVADGVKNGITDTSMSQNNTIAN